MTPSEELAPTEEAPRGTEGGTQESEGTVQPDSTTVVLHEDTTGLTTPEVLEIDQPIDTGASPDSNPFGTESELITPDTTPTTEVLLKELLLGITVEIPR